MAHITVQLAPCCTVPFRWNAAKQSAASLIDHDQMVKAMRHAALRRARQRRRWRWRAGHAAPLHS